jgi:hypothetical protein
MSFAFLFLTYDNFVKKNIRKFLKNQNIYIHPKYPNNVNLKYKKYIIKNLIDTKWADISIVHATLNLLEVAYKNVNNKFFILLSEDSYPLYNFKTFENRFYKIYENKSIFNYKCNDGINWKTSQWWILNRTDVKIILNNRDVYKFSKLNGAIDEYYFLSTLKLCNSNYEFTDLNIMYERWLSYTVKKSPIYFNKLLESDIHDIKTNKSLFIRKILTTFSTIKYINKKIAYIIYIGTETDQNKLILNDKYDIILIISININLINKEIKDRSIYIFNIIYKYFYESIINICYELKLTGHIWNTIIFGSEKFILPEDYKIENKKKELQVLPYNNFYFINKKLENIKQFNYIRDKYNNLGFMLVL